MAKFSYICVKLNLNNKLTMKKILLIVASAAMFVATATAQVVQQPVVYKTGTGIRLYDRTVPRTEIILPKIKGYTLYKGDFHVHTIYSDGDVTPRERMREAWYDGLDVIAITDHLEIRTYEKFMLKALQPYSKDGEPFVYQNAGAGNKKNQDAPMMSNLNAGYEEALQYVEREQIPVLPIRATEIWRRPSEVGEFNALFLQDINAICDKDLFECFRRVKEQGGILIHNHPGWSRKTMEKSEVQVRAYSEGWISGVECVNSTTLYPTIIDRCIDEKLTMFANTDVHRPSSQVWARGCGIFRTMTFIMAKECTEKAIKDAILKRRTIAYSANNLIGEVMWLDEFLNAAVTCELLEVNEKKGVRVFQLTNTCSIPFLLRRGTALYTLNPFQSLRVSISRNKETGEYYEPEFQVDNMWSTGDKHPRLTLKIDK